MALNTTHPQYSDFAEDWVTLRDTYRGEKVIKQKGVLYLPATSGMEADGMLPGNAGFKAYDAYKKRAVFPGLVSDAVEAMIGMMHSKPPTIELPAVLEPMRLKATINGENLEHLLRRINEQQLVTGRVGLLFDFPSTPTIGDVTPYITTYLAEHIINWDEGARGRIAVPKLNLVVLNESEYERKEDFDWEYVEKYRVLALGEPHINEDNGIYSFGLFTNKDDTGASTFLFDPSLMQVPTLRGKASQSIPFVFINSKDIVPTPDDPPLVSLARLVLAIYRGEADYRQNLFMQGQDTLVVTGSNEENFRVGAGATIALPQGGDAKYIGVTSEGLAEQRQSIENDFLRAQQKAGQLIDGNSKQKESGDALQIRVAAQTATLKQIAISGAAGLEQLLKIAAVWMGANPDEVKVAPNLEFVDIELTGKTLVELMTFKAMGGPISQKTIHELMKCKSLTKLEFEDELREIEEEAPLGGMGTDAGGNPNNTTQDNQQ